MLKASTASLAGMIRWERDLLEADVIEAAQAFNTSIHGFAKRLSPAQRARFVMALDSALYSQLGEAAIAASCQDGDGLHPKHRLTNYHEFFVSRVHEGERVIDLGSGVGALALSMAIQSKAIVHGVDWKQENVDVASARANACGMSTPRATFELGDITTHRAAGTFDVVVLSNVLEHIDRRVERLRLWTQWYQPKRFLIRVPNFERDWRVSYKRELGVEWRADVTHEIEYTRGQLEEELKSAGWRVEECHACWGEWWVVAVPVVV